MVHHAWPLPIPPTPFCPQLYEQLLVVRCPAPGHLTWSILYANPHTLSLPKLYEQLLVVRCPAASGPAPQLAPPAWDGLMCALRTHTFVSRDTSLRLAVETTLNLTSLGDELKGESTTSPPSRAASPPRSASPPPPLPPSNGTAPAPAVNGNGGGGAATRPLLQLGQSPVAAVRSYAARALPCADWSNNTVHSGGYGPTIASSVFYHQPVLGVRQDDLIANMPSPPPPPLPPLPAAWAPPPAAPRSAVLAAVAAAAVKPPTAQQKGTKISGSVNAPAPAVAPPPSPRLQRHFLRGSSVRTDRGSGMSAGADGADGGGGRRALLQQEEEQSLAPPPPLPPPYDCRTVGGGAAVPPAPPSPPQWFESGEPLPIMVHIFDWYGQKVRHAARLYGACGRAVLLLWSCSLTLSHALALGCYDTFWNAKHAL